jgi:hypothetical protein
MAVGTAGTTGQAVRERPIGVTLLAALAALALALSVELVLTSTVTCECESSERR